MRESQETATRVRSVISPAATSMSQFRSRCLRKQTSPARTNFERPPSRYRILRRQHKIAPRVAASQLAIRQNVETDLFLAPNRLENERIFDLSQLLSSRAGLSRAQQRSRAQQTANVIGSILGRHEILQGDQSSYRKLKREISRL